MQKIPALDGIRGIAVLVVIFCHTDPQIFRGGNIGVDLFFVLSGFLITSILLGEYHKTGAINFLNFYARRACRLLPAMFTYVGVILIGTAFLAPASMWATLRDSVFVTVYLYNWHLVVSGASDHLDLFSHLWSLSVEEQFYTFWPLMLAGLLAPRNKRVAFLLACAAAILVPTIARIALWKSGPSMPMYWNTGLRIDSLAWGVLAAGLVHEKALPKRLELTGWCGFAGLLMFLALARFDLLSGGFLYQGGYTLVCLLCALAILVAATSPPAQMRSLLEMKWLCWVGKISYGLYIWHFAAFHMAAKLFPQSLVWQNAAGLSATFAISALSFYLIEIHFLRLKSRFHGSSPPSLTASPRTAP